MSSRTSGFAWSFGAGSSRDRNSASSAALNFSAAGRYISFVRESVQNSLDFPLDDTKPVEMTFRLSEITGKEYPELFAIGEHIKECKNAAVDNPRALKEYVAMTDRLYPNGVCVDRLRVLTVSDYNTRGMYYDTTSERARKASPFYCFALSEGSSRKFGAGPAGGSFGFGKNAYFSMSPFKTLVVSTMVGEGEYSGKCFMLGVSALIAHTHKGAHVTDYGCFGLANNPLEPVSNTNVVPEIFRRTQPGTDMHIIGTYDESDDDIYLILKKAVLNHFWLAILDGKLNVTIGEETITKDNIDTVLMMTFENVCETGYAADYDGWCPTEYYKALVESRKDSSVRNPCYSHFEQELPHIGKAHLYLHAFEEGKDRLAYIRGLRMVVQKVQRRTGLGYCGVFFCDNKEGNLLLGQLEPFEHNAWDKRNWRDEATGKIRSEAAEIIGAIDRFIAESIAKVFSREDQEEIPVQGLNSLLGGEEIDSNPYGVDNGGTTGDGTTGRHEIWDTSEPKTASLNAEDSNHSRMTFVANNKVVYRDPNGTTTIVVGRKKRTHPTQKHPTGKGGTATEKVRLEDGTDHPCILKAADVHIVNSSDSSNYYDVIFSLEKQIESAFVKLDIGSDNGRAGDCEVELSEAIVNGRPVPHVRGGNMRGFSLTKGENTIRVAFKDGIRHAMEVEIYELAHD